jgi:hypothetical protein
MELVESSELHASQELKSTLHASVSGDQGFDESLVEFTIHVCQIVKAAAEDKR